MLNFKILENLRKGKRKMKTRSFDERRLDNLLLDSLEKLKYYSDCKEKKKVLIFIQYLRDKGAIEHKEEVINELYAMNEEYD